MDELDVSNDDHDESSEILSGGVIFLPNDSDSSDSSDDESEGDSSKKNKKRMDKVELLQYIKEKEKKKLQKEESRPAPEFGPLKIKTKHVYKDVDIELTLQEFEGIDCDGAPILEGWLLKEYCYVAQFHFRFSVQRNYLGHGCQFPYLGSSGKFEVQFSPLI